MNALEREIISNFTQKRYRDRYLDLLSSSRGRARFRRTLAHGLKLRPELSFQVPGDDSGIPQIFSTLRTLGAPDECCVISESNQLDGAMLPLMAALDQIVGSQVAGILCCKPDLGFYESEDPGLRFVLSPVPPRRR